MVVVLVVQTYESPNSTYCIVSCLFFIILVKQYAYSVNVFL